jgi:hypothetical protein
MWASSLRLALPRAALDDDIVCEASLSSWLSQVMRIGAVCALRAGVHVACTCRVCVHCTCCVCV